ncbi:MAG TPA: hypothetical protein DC000_00085 [Clostridiales bacterium]|nr:hypothetical protein [Clostridiales bacterium]
MQEDIWVSVEKFRQYYDLKKTRAYELIHAKGFPSMKIGPKGVRVNLAKTDEFFKKYYNN